MNIVKLSDKQLMDYQQQITAELQRRNNPSPCDFADIRGMESEKRAMTVAAVGNHSIVLVGASGIGKTMLRGALHRIAPEILTFESRACDCGNHWDMQRDCMCSVATVRKVFRKVPITQLALSVTGVSEKEFRSELLGTSSETIRHQIEAGRQELRPRTMDKDATELLGYAMTEKGFPPAARQTAIDVAGTIAAMAGSTDIEASHIAEAVNYLRPTEWGQ